MMPWLQSIAFLVSAMVVELAVSRHQLFLPALAVAGFYELLRRGLYAWLCLLLPLTSFYDWILGRTFPVQPLLLPLAYGLVWSWKRLGGTLSLPELAVLAPLMGLAAALPPLGLSFFCGAGPETQQALLFQGGLLGGAGIFGLALIIERRQPGWHGQRLRDLFAARERP